MDHSAAITQILLTISLGLNGSRLGDRLVLWCRPQRERLLIVSLCLLCLGAALFYFYVFASLRAEFHILILALAILSNAVWITCFNEWVRMAPRPWGKGETRTVPHSPALTKKELEQKTDTQAIL